MPIKSRVTKWKCKDCKTTYDSSDDALTCEDSHWFDKKEKEFKKLFPTTHISDDKVHKYCVSCGKKVAYFNPNNELKHSCECHNVFGGLYCTECYKTLKDRLYIALKETGI